MSAPVEHGSRATGPDTADSPAAAAEAEAVPPEHVTSVSVGVVTADREAFDGDGVQHFFAKPAPIDWPTQTVAPTPTPEQVRRARLSRWQEQRE
jgi:hypothetical protein